MSGSFLIKRGDLIGLVRWKGDMPELVSGTYRGHDARMWRLEVHGTVAEYERGEWQLCLE